MSSHEISVLSSVSNISIRSGLELDCAGVELGLEAQLVQVKTTFVQNVQFETAQDLFCIS